jgi:hypothetical protein
LPPIHAEPARFVFLGERRYVHGTTMLARLSDAIRRLDPDSASLGVHQFVVRSELRDSDGAIEVHRGDAAPAEPGRLPVAELRTAVAGEPVAAAVYAAPGTAVSGRDTRDRERELVRDATLTEPFSGRATLHGVADEHELVRAIVEATKQLHVLTLDGRNPSIRWVSLRGAVLPYDIGAQGDLELREEHLGEVRSRGRRFSRARIEVDSLPALVPGEIGFSFDAAGA